MSEKFYHEITDKQWDTTFTRAEINRNTKFKCTQSFQCNILGIVKRGKMEIYTERIRELE